MEFKYTRIIVERLIVSASCEGEANKIIEGASLKDEMPDKVRLIDYFIIVKDGAGNTVLDVPWEEETKSNATG